MSSVQSLFVKCQECSQRPATIKCYQLGGVIRLCYSCDQAASRMSNQPRKTEIIPYQEMYIKQPSTATTIKKQENVLNESQKGFGASGKINRPLEVEPKTQNISYNVDKQRQIYMQDPKPSKVQEQYPSRQEYKPTYQVNKPYNQQIDTAGSLMERKSPSTATQSKKESLAKQTPVQLSSQKKVEEPQNKYQDWSRTTEQPLNIESQKDTEQRQKLKDDLRMISDQVEGDFKKRIQSNEQVVKNLNNKVNDTQKQIEESQKLLKKLQQEQTSLQKQIKTVQDQHQREMEKSANEYQNKLGQISQELESKQQQLEELMQELQNYNFENIQVAFEQMQTELKQKDEQIEQLQQQLGDVEGQENGQEQQNGMTKEQEQELQQLQQQLENKQEEQKKLEELIENFKQLYENMNNEKESLREENEKLQQENEQFREIFQQNLHLFGIDPNQIQDGEENQEGEEGYDQEQEQYYGQYGEGEVISELEHDDQEND